MTSTFNITEYTTASYSFLKGLDPYSGAPSKLKHEREMGRGADTDAQRFGKALDCQLLQPDSFYKQFKVYDSIPKTDTVKYRFVKLALYAMAKNRGRSFAIRFAKRFSKSNLKLGTLDKKFSLEGEYSPEINWVLSQGRFVPLDPFEYDAVMWGAESARSYEPFKPYLEHPEKEIQKMIEWTNPATGISCKGEPDLFRRGHWVADIKSCRTANPRILAGRWGDIRKLHYGEQIYAYGEGLGESLECPRLIMAIEKQAPFACSLIQISEDDLYYFRENFWKWCATFKHVQENNLWHMGYEYHSKYKAVVEMDNETHEMVARVETHGMDYHLSEIFNQF